jgi:hypothetical protein
MVEHLKFALNVAMSEAIHDNEILLNTYSVPIFACEGSPILRLLRQLCHNLMTDTHIDLMSHHIEENRNLTEIRLSLTVLFDRNLGKELHPIELMFDHNFYSSRSVIAR